MTKKIISSLSRIALSALVTLSVFSFTAVDAKAEGIGSVSISSATISNDGEKVTVTASVAQMPQSDDGKLYLFAEKVYQNEPAGSPVASVAMNTAVTFSFPLDYKTTNCKLYDKFQVAVLSGGVFVPVSGTRYITNPEALAKGSPKRKNAGKKGLILDGAKIGNGTTEASQLGVQQAAYNINLEDVIGGNGGVVFEYNGKTYYYDSSYLSQYDHAVRTCTQQGMGVTIVLLNPYVAGEEFMISPYSRGAHSRYYMMNTSDDVGLENLEAVVTYLAYRYNGQNGFGQVDNWVIGNEVNAKNEWNIANVSDEMLYAQLYADELRVCYNAIKSKNENAHVCASFDHNWTYKNTPSYFSARSLLEAMNACIVAQGNFDWALAQHPYNYPMVWTSFWTPKSEATAAMIRHDIDTPYISMQNIEQLTDYMCQPAMRNTKGAVRPILLTEVGYSSTQGEEAQAAAIVYAYQRALTNRYINMIVFNRQTDYPVEVADGLSVGLTAQDGYRKLAFEFYQQMSGPSAGSYIQRAAANAGIADWNAAMYAR